jgi:signal peptidase I
MNHSDRPAEAPLKVAEERARPLQQPEDTTNVPAKPAKKQDSFLEVVKTIVYALLIAGVIRSFLFQPFNIPSGSMEGTLLIGDYLFVSKAAYGYSEYSLPWAFLPFHGRFFASQPHRGDVVVFKYPGDNTTDYIKRVIGLPGDRIQMKDDRLYINAALIPETRTTDFVGTDPCPGGSPIAPAAADGTVHVPRYIETLPGGATHTILDCDPHGALDDTQVFVVPEGHYFMMGDNRDNSADSRADVGYVPFDNLVGKAEIIFFSTNGRARFWEFWKWPFAIRYARIGELIH